MIKSIVEYKLEEYKIKMSEYKDEFTLAKVNKKIIREYIEVGVELGIQIKEIEIVIHMLSKGLDEEIISRLTEEIDIA